MGSFYIARDVVYPQVLSDKYISRNEARKDVEIITRQVAKAGVRLAAVLNRTLQ